MNLGHTIDNAQFVRPARDETHLEGRLFVTGPGTRSPMDLVPNSASLLLLLLLLLGLIGLITWYRRRRRYLRRRQTHKAGQFANADARRELKVSPD